MKNAPATSSATAELLGMAVLGGVLLAVTKPS